MKKWIGKFLMFVAGWKWNLEVDISEIKKSVCICAPHTSNWDFYYAVFGFWALEVPIKVIIKDSHTKAWYGSLIKWMGGIGIDRTQAGDMIATASNIIQNQEKIAFIVTPEGSRSYSKQWKKGFYYIAKRADVPILVGIGDYKDKACRIVKKIDINNRTYEEVAQEIEPLYKKEHAKYPEKYNPEIYIRK